MRVPHLQPHALLALGDFARIIEALLGRVTAMRMQDRLAAQLVLQPLIATPRPPMPGAPVDAVVPHHCRGVVAAALSVQGIRSRFGEGTREGLHAHHACSPVRSRLLRCAAAYARNARTISPFNERSCS